MLDDIWDRFWGAKAWWQAFFRSCTVGNDTFFKLMHSGLDRKPCERLFTFSLWVFVRVAFTGHMIFDTDQFFVLYTCILNQRVRACYVVADRRAKGTKFFLICEKKRKMWATCCVCVINRGGFWMWTLDSCSVDSFCSLSYSVGRWQMMNRKVRALATAAPKRVECEGVMFEWRW